MLVSELIKKLEKIQAEQGDLVVTTWDAYHDCKDFHVGLEVDKAGKELSINSWHVEEIPPCNS